MIDTRLLRWEKRIVWLRPVETLPRYVRERLATGEPRRVGISRRRHPGIVGYAELRADAPNEGFPGSFARRVFWLADHDPYERWGAPIEAVDPRTVEPGVPGLLTDRAWGEPR